MPQHASAYVWPHNRVKGDEDTFGRTTALKGTRIEALRANCGELTESRILITPVSNQSIKRGSRRGGQKGGGRARARERERRQCPKTEMQ